MIIKKSAQEIDKMARAGLILAATHDLIESNIRPGVSTAELDKLAERFIRSRGATPTFKGYRGFPGSICASPNAMVVHGIPGPYRLKNGDIISIDIGVTLDGWVADAARTFAVGDVEPAVLRLLAVTEESLHAGVAQCRPGNRMGDLSNAIQRVVEDAGFSVVRSLVGHGVGRSMHEDPQVPNHGKPGKGPLLEQGMVLAIEPMTTAGRPGVRVGGDGWAIFSQDGSATAHFEFSVAITGTGPRILTPWHLPVDMRTDTGAEPRPSASSPEGEEEEVALGAGEAIAEGIASAG
ncbi:MAG TPA: type I methionyl aminopeptidase [Solirubrobacteraceae bacterium]|nr:type I methionyl aminopeptidase [Solirubrobacteraceae bacterium]